MTGPASLQWRLSLWLVLGVAMMWIAATVTTGLIISSEMNEVFDVALQETAQRILPLAVNDITARDVEGVSQRVADVREHKELLTYLVRDDQDRVLLKSHDADETIFPQFQNFGFLTTDSHRIFFDSAVQGTITIAVAEPLSHRSEATRETFIGLLTPLFILVPLSLIVIWSLVRNSLKPVRRFQREIETRGSGDLAAISIDMLPAEIKPVAHAVNNLMDRLRRALISERSFTANSAHELRTPVAAALAQVQRLILETGDAAARERATQIEIALLRLAALSEKLMQLAKSEGAALTTARQHDILPVLRLVLQDFERDQSNQNRITATLPQAGVLTKIDPDAFAILVRNLIENALKHGDQAQPVNVSITPDGVLRVVNSGDIIPSATRQALMQPFVRGPSQSQGTGLGLAIVNAIAQGSGSTIELVSPATGKSDGFEVVVKLA